MTTIAYKDGVVAYDSLSTQGDVIVNHQQNKCRVRNNVRFFLAGTCSDADRLIDLWFGKSIDVSPDKIDAIAIVISDGKVYMTGVDKDGLWCDLIDEKCQAIGSGREFAFGAMDMGASAVQAVKIACGRDTKSGGRVRSYQV